MFLMIWQNVPTRIGHPILGIIIPAFIFLLSFGIAFGLYRHFSKQINQAREDDFNKTEQVLDHDVP